MDTSGPNLVSIVRASGLNIDENIVQEIVPDEVLAITKTLEKWSDTHHLHLILTTGGTGFAPRDVTPEVYIYIYAFLLLHMHIQIKR